MDNKKHEQPEKGSAGMAPMQRFVMCDCCEQEWEKSFFCNKCSGFETIDCEVPNLMWGGWPPDEEMEMGTEDIWNDVCLNCCPGHVNT